MFGGRFKTARFFGGGKLLGACGFPHFNFLINTFWRQREKAPLLGGAYLNIQFFSQRGQSSL